MMYLLVDAKGHQALLEWDNTNLPYNLLWSCSLIYNLSTGQFRKNRLLSGLNIDDEALKDLPAASQKFSDTEPKTALGFVASNGFSTLLESVPQARSDFWFTQTTPVPTMSPKRQIYLHTYQRDVLETLRSKPVPFTTLVEVGKGAKGQT